MCGRYTYRFTWGELHRLMQLSAPAPEDAALLSSFNVAPTQLAPVVRQDAAGIRSVSMLRWGLVPSWSKDPKSGFAPINARSEDAASKPMFRHAIKKQRCLVPISGFYEWQKLEGEKTKQPWLIRVKGVPLFGLAGLWERWDKGDEPLETFTILTGSPNTLVAPIHDRMPCILSPESYSAWLDSSVEDFAQLAPTLAPCSAKNMEAYRVSTRVNSPRINDEALTAPV